MSLADAIERNRARQAQKRAGIKPDENLKPFRVRVAVIPSAYEVAMGLAAPIEVGQVPPSEIRIIYGTSKQDAMDRAGIQ
jgi:hypothetical protein